jgi:hypothetical protein
MNLLTVQNRITELMSKFVIQIKGTTAIGRTDLNRVSETILIPLFAELYGYKNLKNLNYSEGPNYPGIDLGDEIARVAFQITATPTGQKVKNALQKFVRYELYKQYDRLVVYVLTERQNSYSSYPEITGGNLVFDAHKDILDYRDVLKEVAAFQIDKARRVQDILEANFGEGTPQTDEWKTITREISYCLHHYAKWYGQLGSGHFDDMKRAYEALQQCASRLVASVHAQDCLIDSSRVEEAKALLISISNTLIDGDILYMQQNPGYISDLETRKARKTQGRENRQNAERIKSLLGLSQ